MFEPLDTDRLTIRNPVIGDVDALHERRNHPDAARYQDWDYPYSVGAARTLMADAVTLDGPTVGEWWMATIVERASGRIVGDLATKLDSGGRAATIGYTFHPHHWGQGYATEATGALIDRLLADGVRRVTATIDPDNLASARVLERLGFRHEGRTVGSWFQGNGPDSPAGDDVIFGLTVDDRATWLARPTSPPADLRLVEIDTTNQRAVAALQTHWSQRNLVAPVAASYGDALFPPLIGGEPVIPWLRAIEVGDANEAGGTAERRLAGFVMLALPAAAGPREPYLWRLLVDRCHQRRGIASRALDVIEDGLRAEGHRAVGVHWVDGPGSPGPFYLGRGYEPTGNVHDGEIEGRKPLDPAA